MSQAPQTPPSDLPHHWIAAWNAHDLDAILSHYDESVQLTSPVVAQLLGDPTGTLSGKAALKAYFSRGLQAYPNLQFHLEEVLWGLNTVVLYYINQKGTHTAECMQLSPQGKITKVIAHYSA